MVKKLSAREKRWIERTVCNNRSYKLFLYNRFFLFLLLVLAQLAAYIAFWYLFVYQSVIGVWVQFATSVLTWVVILRLINKHGKSSLKLNWILLILAAPIFGVPSYILYGGGRPTRNMRKKIQKSQNDNERILQEVYGAREQLQVKERTQSISKYLQDFVGYPVFHDGEVTYYAEGEKMFPEMLAALRKAEKYILLEYFIISPGKMWNEIHRRF